MSQLRKDPINGRWVIVDVENPKSASSFNVTPVLRTSKTCPFCPGNEAMTPPEITAYGRKGAAKSGSGWQVRVIPNKFPALRIEEKPEKFAFGVYDKIGGFGAHEVIIENPDHQVELGDLPQEHIEWILRAYRERSQDLRKDPRIKYIMIFKNYGAGAGASLEHPHSQLIALPVVPSRILGKLKGALKHYEYAERCAFCDILNQERAEKKLAVLEEGGFVVLAPFVSRFPFELAILPTAHQADFDSISDESLAALAGVLRKTLRKLKHALGNPSFNLMIQTLPVHSKEQDSFHWHVEIIPHLTQVAGFEMGTGFYVNPVPPENAAAALREAAV